MPGFTIEPLPTIGAVRLVFDYSDWDDPDPDTAVDEVQVFRLTVPPTDPEWFNHLRKVRVRPTYRLQDQAEGQYGQPWEMFNTVDVWYDVEAPLDTPLWYIIETVGGGYSYLFGYPFTQVAVNPDFEVNIIGWTADLNGAVTRETIQPIFGTGSLRIRATAAGPTGARSTANIPIAGGRMYTLSAWVRSGGSTAHRIGVDWLNGSNVVVGTDLCTPTTVPAATAVRRSVTAVAPVGAVSAKIRFQLNTAEVDAALVVDRVRFSEMNTGNTLDPPSVTLASNGGGWFTDPVEPGTDVRLSLLPTDGCDVDTLAADGTLSGVIFASHSTEVRASAGARFDVVDQSLPVAINSVRKGPTATLTLASVSLPDRDAVHAVLATGRVTLLRLPPEFGIADRYTDVADVNTAALSQDLRLPYRVIDMPYASSPSPSAPIAGVRGTRFEDLTRYSTWAQLDAADLTSIDLLHGAGSPAGGVTL